MRHRLGPPALPRASALAAALASLPLALCGNFVAALHSNFVVSLDFEGDARTPATDDKAAASKEADDGQTHVMAFAGGERKFRCRLPSQNRTASNSPDVSKAKAHFLAAKLVPLRGQCWKMSKDYWTYDVCFGRKVVQYRPDSEDRFSLGEHDPELDELLPGGGVREHYFGGTENRSLVIQYVCGSSESSSRTFKIEEPQPLEYLLTVSGPAFCAWREKDGAEARDDQGNVFPLSALLEETRGGCLNTTFGYWTYEYCYPRGLTQFHLANGKRQPEHTLGTLSGSSAPMEANRVGMSLVRLKPSISARERRAPPSNHWTLQQRLGGGTVCDETHRARVTFMQFQCPPNWQSRPEMRIVSINEASLCEYEVLVHTTLLCGHRKLVPTLPKGKETIHCVTEPQAA